MTMKKTFCLLLTMVSACLVTYAQKNTYKYPFQNPQLSIEAKGNNLVSLLSIEERIGQMVNNAPAKYRKVGRR
jgi:beta-glucosidase